MSETVLKVENLSKMYRLGQVGTGTLSHDLNRWWHRVRGKEDPYLKIGESNDRSQKGDSDYVWALKDINFEVKQGEVLGIIGKNGAGKSTLLKILSKVTGPTTGSVKAKGRIASLLEVGTGFHPELTGKENIYLNGTILGMTKAEVKAKLDEIVDFAGVDRYLDTPVKRYSSGMKVRLGFAVAAYLEPEILIVDEVLAVGDAEFQKKAIGKMQDVSTGEGRTVLFVSHNMVSIKSLCSSVLLIENGNTKMFDLPEVVIDHYLSKVMNINKDSKIIYFNNSEPNTGNENISLKAFGVKAENKDYMSPILMEEPIIITIEMEKEKANQLRYDITLQFKDETGAIIFTSSTSRWLQENILNGSEAGVKKFTCVIPGNFFNSGSFTINLLIIENFSRVILRKDSIVTFNVIPKTQMMGDWMGRPRGPLLPKLNWKVTYQNIGNTLYL